MNTDPPISITLHEHVCQRIETAMIGEDYPVSWATTSKIANAAIAAMTHSACDEILQHLPTKPDRPSESAISLLKELRDTTPMVVQRKRIDAFFAAMGDADTRKDSVRDECGVADATSPHCPSEISVGSLLKTIITNDVIIRNMRHRDARWHDDPDVQKVLEANTRIIQAWSKKNRCRLMPLQK